MSYKNYYLDDFDIDDDLELTLELVQEMTIDATSGAVAPKNNIDGVVWFKVYHHGDMVDKLVVSDRYGTSFVRVEPMSVVDKVLGKKQLEVMRRKQAICDLEAEAESIRSKMIEMEMRLNQIEARLTKDRLK